jgi:hypothetical protein
LEKQGISSRILLLKEAFYLHAIDPVLFFLMGF